MSHQADGIVGRDIAARIERLNGERRRLAPHDVMRELRAVRKAAHSAELEAVATLALALEGELLSFGDEAPIHAYLDRMHDAVEVAAGDQQRFVELALAAVGTRLALA